MARDDDFVTVDELPELLREWGILPHEPESGQRMVTENQADNLLSAFTRGRGKAHKPGTDLDVAAWNAKHPKNPKGADGKWAESPGGAAGGTAAGAAKKAASKGGAAGGKPGAKGAVKSESVADVEKKFGAIVSQEDLGPKSYRVMGHDSGTVVLAKGGGDNDKRSVVAQLTADEGGSWQWQIGQAIGRVDRDPKVVIDEFPLHRDSGESDAKFGYDGKGSFSLTLPGRDRHTMSADDAEEFWSALRWVAEAAAVAAPDEVGEDMSTGTSDAPKVKPIYIGNNPFKAWLAGREYAKKKKAGLL